MAKNRIEIDRINLASHEFGNENMKIHSELLSTNRSISICDALEEVSLN